MGAGVQRRSAFAFIAIAIWLLAIVFVRPLSVDESQYVAATSLTAKGLLPYRDYAYLQTPLQPFVLAPLQWLFAGHLLLAMRLANALLALVTVIFVYAAGRRIGASERAALAAALLLATCQSFAWCAGVARNDLLPAALMSVGLWVIAGWRVPFVAGLALGLAASAKISYAVPAAIVFLAIAWSDRKQAFQFAAGVVVGLVPTAILAALAPRQFIAEAIVFPATAPAQYYTEIGKAWRLGPVRFLQLLQCAALGPALIAAIEVARRSREWFGDPARRAMLAAAAGGMISAALNEPFQIFYLMPALPPLFVLASLVLAERRPRWLSAVWALFAVAGLAPVAGWFVRAATVVPLIDAERRSSALAAALRAEGIAGPVATMAGQFVDNVDPRFAAGPFLYRARGFVSESQAREWQMVTRDQAGTLAAEPPAAIVTGTYPDSQPNQERELAEQARPLGYRPVADAAGFTIWARRP